jgi:hypothetical protein
VLLHDATDEDNHDQKLWTLSPDRITNIFYLLQHSVDRMCPQFRMNLTVDMHFGTPAGKEFVSKKLPSRISFTSSGAVLSSMPDINLHGTEH